MRGEPNPPIENPCTSTGRSAGAACGAQRVGARSYDVDVDRFRTVIRTYADPKDDQAEANTEALTEVAMNSAAIAERLADTRDEALPASRLPRKHWRRRRTNASFGSTHLRDPRRSCAFGSFPDGQLASMLATVRHRHVTDTPSATCPSADMERLKTQQGTSPKIVSLCCAGIQLTEGHAKPTWSCRR